MKRVGVLALQGAFSEHIAMLRRVGAEAFPVRLPRELRGLDGLVIPGGESTTIGRLMRDYQLFDKVKSLATNDFPILGTCAGMILLAKRVSGLDWAPLAAMDVEVRRNAFGRQVDSFETELAVPVLGEEPFHAVFIRAPLIERAGSGVQLLARLEDGTAVAAREKNLVVSAFHPELTTDLRFHAYFLDIVASHCGRKRNDSLTEVH